MSTPEVAMKSDIQTTVVEEPVKEEEPEMNGTAVSVSFVIGIYCFDLDLSLTTPTMAMFMPYRR